MRINKMSDTPRTDDATYYTHLTEEGLGGEPVVPVCFAEELERELAAMTAERDELCKDAKRYRALRVWPCAQGALIQHWPTWGPGTQYPDSADVVDAVIDSFMKDANMLSIPWPVAKEKPR
jgi:hypothetical protein